MFTQNAEKTNTYIVQPIGSVHRPENGYFLHIAPPYRAGLKQLEHFSHVIVLWWADRQDTPESRGQMTCYPPYAPDKLTGVFATRAEYRPNPIGRKRRLPDPHGPTGWQRKLPRQAFIFGKDCQKEGGAIRQQVGYLPGELSLYANMKAHEFFEMVDFHYFDASANALRNGQAGGNVITLLLFSLAAFGLAASFFQQRDITVGVWTAQVQHR